MTEGPAVPWAADELWLQVHRTLQVLADRLPDEAVVAVRRALAGDDVSAAAAEAAGLLAHVLLSGRIPTSDLELTVIEECLLALGRDTSGLVEIPAADGPPEPTMHFTAGPDGAVAGDAAVLGALAGHPGVLAVRRTWRRSADAAAGPPPIPFYLVETADAASLRDVVRVLHGAPAHLGPSPGEGPGLDAVLVEPYVTGHALPDLHQRADRAARLLHTGRTGPQFALADLFDGPPGPDGRPAELVPLPPSMARALLERLSAGRQVAAVGRAAGDVLDPAAGTVVPLDLVTDGRWIWSAATEYYLRRHLVAPPRDFHAYLVTTPAPSPPADEVVAEAARWLRDVAGPAGLAPG